MPLQIQTECGILGRVRNLPRDQGIISRKGKAMAKNARGIILLTVIFILVAFWSQPAGSFDKKLRVVIDYAHVYLNPDEESPIIATIERGGVLSLLYSGKTKKSWYYVCFKSEKTGVTKSGYVADLAVEPLYDILKTITIKEEDERITQSLTPRKFDEMKWGATKKDVLESEGKPLNQEKIKGQDVMRYEQKVINLDCSIEYVFSSNRLHQTKFHFMNEHINKNSYLEDYQRIKEALAQRFGRPHEENMHWHDTSFKDDFSSWGEAVSLGQLELSSLWFTPQTQILATLSGRDDAIHLLVEYSWLQTKSVAKKSSQE